MKKIITIALSVLAFAAVTSAQPRAIGLRIGGSAEATYQHSIGGNFIEGDLGLGILNGGGFYATGIYDFVIGSIDNFNFYAGPGLQMGLYNGVNDNAEKTTKFFFGLAGQVGFEWQFTSIPLNLSLDWRPGIDFCGAGFYWSSFALGVRYRF